MEIELQEKKQTLKNIPLFSELSIDQLRKITSISKLKKYEKNDILFNDGDPYTGFYIILKGIVKIFKTSQDGKDSVLHIVKPLNPFADVPLFEGGNFPANAQAIVESLTIFIPKEDFLKLLSEDKEISFKMLAGFAKRLRSMTSKIEDFSSKDVINRLAKYLLNEIINNKTDNQIEPHIKLTVPKSTIAAYIGTITETLSRTFKKLQKEGIIRVNGKKIFILDKKRLKQLAG